LRVAAVANFLDTAEVRLRPIVGSHEQKRKTEDQGEPCNTHFCGRLPVSLLKDSFQGGIIAPGL